MEDSRQVRYCYLCYLEVLRSRLDQQHKNRNGNAHLCQLRDERILQKEEVSLINHAVPKVYEMYLEKIERSNN